MLGEYDKKLWRVIKHYVGEARLKEDFSDVFVIGIDETSCKKGHESITLVVDNKDSKVIFACEGKDSSTISNFREDLQNHNGNSSNIRLACCDMSPSYINGISKEFPHAKTTVDKFHVMKAMNEGVNEVRKQEQKNKKLKNTKFIWLTNDEMYEDETGSQKGEIQKRKIVETEIFSVDERIKIISRIELRAR